MDKNRRLFIALLVAGLFVAGIFLGAKVSRWFAGRFAPRVYNTPALLVQVQTLSQLVTVKYVIEKVEILEVPSDNLIGQLTDSKNRVLLLAHGVVKAGIDFNGMKAGDLRVEGKKVYIKLPPARITDAYLDEKETKVIDRTTGLFAPSDKNLEQETRQNAVDDIRRAARNGGILKDAEDRARAQLTNLFRQMGFEEVEFQLPDKPEAWPPS